MQNPDFLRQFSSPEMMQVSWASFVGFMHVNFEHVVSPTKHLCISKLLPNDEVSLTKVIDCFFWFLANDDSTAITFPSE